MGKLSFSTVSAVQSGVRQGGNVLSQLFATSTQGGFRLTGAATKLLGIKPGDYVMFINTVNEIDASLEAKNPEDAAYAAMSEWAVAQGIDMSALTPEDVVAIHKEFDEWYVAKGIALFDGNGKPKVAYDRIPMEERIAYATENFDELVEPTIASLEDSKAKDAIEDVKVLKDESVDKEARIAIVAKYLKRPVDAYQGSKSANPSGMVGIGVSVQFADTNTWMTLKADLQADMDKYNRVFTLPTETEVLKVWNGKEYVDVRCLALGTSEDKVPGRRGEESEE